MDTLYLLKCSVCRHVKIDKRSYKMTNKKVQEIMCDLFPGKFDPTSTTFKMCENCYLKCYSFHSFKKLHFKTSPTTPSGPCYEIINVENDMPNTSTPRRVVKAAPKSQDFSVIQVQIAPELIGVTDPVPMRKKAADKKVEEMDVETSLQAHVIEQDTSCIQCADYITTIEYLVNQVKECKPCYEEKFPKQIFKTLGMVDVVWSCPLCSEKVVGHSNIKKHLEERRHTLIWGKSFDKDSGTAKSSHVIIKTDVAVEKKDDNEVESGDDSEINKSSTQKDDGEFYECCPYCYKESSEPAEHWTHVGTHLPNNNYPKIRCPVCPKFILPRSLIQHISTFHRSLRVNCQHCPETFKTVIQLTVHQETDHLEIFQWICPLCDQLIIDYSKFVEHVRETHLTARLSVCESECEQCRDHENVPQLICHIVKHHFGRWFCKGCFLGFILEKDFEEHLQSYSHFLIGKLHVLVKGHFVCHLCDGPTFKTFEEYEAHSTRRHKKLASVSENEEIADPESDVRDDLPKNVVPVKNVVNKGYRLGQRTAKILKLHYKLAASSRSSYCCIDCRLDVTTIQAAQMHNKMHVCSSLVFSYRTMPCPLCGKIFSNDRSQRRHLQTCKLSQGTSKLSKET